MFRFLRFPRGKRTFPTAETYVSHKGNIRFRHGKHKNKRSVCKIILWEFGFYAA